MKTNTVVIISVVAVAGIALYVASRPPVVRERVVEKQAKLSTAQKGVGFVEELWSKINA